MNPVELILKKRTGQILTKEEINFFISGYLNGEIEEYQMSAMLMAIFFQGMVPDEVKTLTEIYIDSGLWIKFPEEMNTVDKHSTGGVGDKVTIILTPWVASCGIKIPMISGRGLGHTGGTLDKLESIKGFRTDFSSDEFIKMVKEEGFSIISQSQELVPADKRIYALRDVTATVESLPLITASIMSKKIAEGAQNLVIDLKVGTGAFIKDIETAKKLGRLLKETGEKLGQRVSVIYSRMNSPLGSYIGNALEVHESIEFLQNKNISSDLYELTLELAIEMLILSGKFNEREVAKRILIENLESGKAYEFFKRFVEFQQGDSKSLDVENYYRKSDFEIPVKAEKSGYIRKINSQEIGYALIDIGAGRMNLDTKLDYSSGLFMPKKIGDAVTSGEKLGIVFCSDAEKGKKVANKILSAIEIVEETVEKEEVIIDRDLVSTL